MQRTFDRGGNVVVPSFAVGRTQEMLYFLREIKEKGLVKGHGNFPVYIDSPLAIEPPASSRTPTRTASTSRPAPCWNRASTHRGAGLRVTVTSDESRMINTDRTPKVILSASGMCEAGRIRHHLKHNLWRPECTILFVGYQAVGTLGRTLIEGATTVKLFGEPIEVQAEICQLTGMSGHADRDGLLRWVNAFTEKPKRVFVMHGEDEVENIFVDTLTGQGFTACAPYNGAQWAIGAEGVSACRRARRYALSTRYRRARTAPPRCSSVWSAPASACCGSSSTTRAVPTRIWPSSPIRSTPCAISGTTERLNNCTGKQNRKTGSPVVSWNHRAACLHVEKMENVTDRRPFRTGACVQSGWGMALAPSAA